MFGFGLGLGLGLGIGSRPGLLGGSTLSASRSIHRLFVLKNWWRLTSWNLASSLSGHCALSPIGLGVRGEGFGARG